MCTGRCKTEQKETTLRAVPRLRQAGLQKRGVGYDSLPVGLLENRMNGEENEIPEQKKRKPGNTSYWWTVRESHNDLGWRGPERLSRSKTLS